MDMKVTTNSLRLCIDHCSTCSKSLNQCIVLIKASYKLLCLEFKSDQTDIFESKTQEIGDALLECQNALGKCSKFLAELEKIVVDYDKTRFR